jgi:hypothetical protein
MPLYISVYQIVYAELAVPSIHESANQIFIYPALTFQLPRTLIINGLEVQVVVLHNIP